MKLSDKDRDILATLYEMPQWAVFEKRFLTDRQMEHAQNAPFAANMDQVFVTRGRILEIKDIASEMKKIHEKSQKA